MTTFRFPADTVELLTDLRANNDKAWFDANRARYESASVEPAKGRSWSWAVSHSQLVGVSWCSSTVVLRVGGGVTSTGCIRPARHRRRSGPRLLQKDAGPELLTQAVHAAAAGDALIAPNITVRLIAAFADISANGPPPQPMEPLTAREEQVVRSMSASARSRRI